MAQSGAAPSEREKYIDLVQRKEHARRLNALWALEADLAAKRTAYAVLDLSGRKIYFKVRGRAFKAIGFTNLDAERRGKPVDPDELAFRAFTLQLKEGKGVETESIQRRTLTEAEKNAAGSDVSDDEPMGAEQGEVENGQSHAPSGGSTEGSDTTPAGTRKMVGVAGGAIPPDPPPRYHMGFDNDLSIWVISDVKRTPQEARYDSFLAFARVIGLRFMGTPAGSDETRITLRLPLPLAQQFYRQFLPGQRLLVTR